MRVPRAGDPVQVRQLLRRSGEGRVVATCRAPGSAAELQKLKEEHAPGRLTVLPLDVTDESTIEVRRTRIAFQFWSAMLQPGIFFLLLLVRGNAHETFLLFVIATEDLTHFAQIAN
jgi:hypothetical protein